MKFLKILVSVLLLIVFVGVLAVVCLYIFIDPNKLKPVIIEEVKNQAGYDLNIEGNLSWSFIPQGCRQY